MDMKGSLRVQNKSLQTSLPITNKMSSFHNLNQMSSLSSLIIPFYLCYQHHHNINLIKIIIITFLIMINFNIFVVTIIIIIIIIINIHPLYSHQFINQWANWGWYSEGRVVDSCAVIDRRYQHAHEYPSPKLVMAYFVNSLSKCPFPFGYGPPFLLTLKCTLNLKRLRASFSFISPKARSLRLHFKLLWFCFLYKDLLSLSWLGFFLPLYKM